MIQEAVVYCDLKDDTLTSLVKELMPSCAKFVAQGDARSFIELWEKSKGDWRSTSRIPEMNKIELFITDQSACSADVTYALYTRRVPVLSLSTSGDSPCDSRFLSTMQSLQANDAAAAIRAFLHFPTQRGRLIVIEGGDGAGKQTQTAMLVSRLRSTGQHAETLDFPHDAAAFGGLIRLLLAGRFGSFNDVDPALFSALYGLNRHDLLPLMRYWIQRGTHVILDRYMTANFGHQAAKYPDIEKRNEKISQMQRFETHWLGLPDADCVLYLNLPPEFAMKALLEDNTRQELDMHEMAKVDYKIGVQQAFLWCCENLRGWSEVRCLDDDAKTRVSREKLHEVIYQKILPLLQE